MRNQETITLFRGMLSSCTVPDDDLARAARAAAFNDGPKLPMADFIRGRRLDHFIDIATHDAEQIAALLREAFGDEARA